MTKSTSAALLALFAGAILVQSSFAQSTANSAMRATAGTAAPDNSKSNREDPSNTTPTADRQSNAATDLDLTKRIRQSVMADKSLSTYAHNVKIVTVNGNVTLNGVVRSDQEKSAIQMKAAEVAGKAKVTNALKIAPNS